MKQALLVQYSSYPLPQIFSPPPKKKNFLVIEPQGKDWCNQGISDRAAFINLSESILSLSHLRYWRQWYVEYVAFLHDHAQWSFANCCRNHFQNHDDHSWSRPLDGSMKFQ